MLKMKLHFLKISDILNMSLHRVPVKTKRMQVIVYSMCTIGVRLESSHFLPQKQNPSPKTCNVTCPQLIM